MIQGSPAVQIAPCSSPMAWLCLDFVSQRDSKFLEGVPVSSSSLETAATGIGQGSDRWVTSGWWRMCRLLLRPQREDTRSRIRPGLGSTLQTA